MLYSTLSIVWIVFLGSLAISSVLLCVQQWQRIKKALPITALLTVFFITVYVGLLQESFNGLEYEDAFEYVYAGHVLGLDSKTRGFDLNPVCVEGSFSNCAQYATLAHPIGLATLISWPVRLMGDSHEIGHFISLVSTWVASLCVFVLLLLWKAPAPVAGLSAIWFLSVPVNVALGSSGFAEPVFAALIAVVAVVAVLAIQSRDSENLEWKARIVNILLMTVLWSALVLAIFIKREGIALAVGLPIGCIWSAFFAGGNGLRFRQRFSGYKAVALISSSAFLFAIIVGGDGLLDWQSIRTTAAPVFTLGFLQRWGVDYALYLLSLQFLYVVPVGILGAAFIWKHPQRAFILPVVMIYFVLFASFGHSYYAQILNEVPYLHFERYTMEILPLLTVMSGLVIAWVLEKSSGAFGRRIAGWGLIAVGCLVVGTGTWRGLSYQKSLSAEEIAFRIEPVENACAVLPEDTTVIASEPVLFYLYCRRDLDVIWRGGIDRIVSLSKLERYQSTGLYLWELNEAVDIENARYPSAASFLQTMERVVVLDYQGPNANFSLYLLRQN